MFAEAVSVTPRPAGRRPTARCCCNTTAVPKSKRALRSGNSTSFCRIVRLVVERRSCWSQWKGYLKEGSGAQLEADCKARSIPFEVIHTSGHASIADLKRLAAAVSPKALVPIHTFGAEQFPELFDNVIPRQDGEWWEV